MGTNFTKLKNIKNAAMFAVLIPITAVAQTADDVFGDIEDKGNVIITFLTGGFFAFAVVALALMWIVIGFLQGRMEWQRALTIIISAVVLGNIPTIANWLLGL